VLVLIGLGEGRWRQATAAAGVGATTMLPMSSVGERCQAAVIPIDPYEFELLAYLVRHANRVLTYRTILMANPAVHTTSHLWERIGRLRRKIEVDPFRPRYLVSEPWVGYRFVDGAW